MKEESNNNSEKKKEAPEPRYCEINSCSNSCPHRGEWENETRDEWGVYPKRPWCYQADREIPKVINMEGYERFPDWCPLICSRPAPSPYARCIWSEDEDGNYHTGCGTAFTFMNGDVSENHMKFCPFCGKTIDDRPFQQQDRQ